MFRKILKYTLRVLAILAGLIVLLVVSLYLPPVQDFIQKKATEYLSEELGMRLSIERFRLRFPLRLSIERAQGITSAGDTLFYCGSLHTAVALKPLLGGEIHIRHFAIDSATFHLAADSTSGLDLKLRVRELALSGRANLSSESAQVPDIRLSGGDIRLILGPSAPDTTAVDTASTPLLWKIAAQRLTLDDIAFAMHTPESATDLTARIARGEVDSCTVNLGTQEITAHRLLIERGDYAYLTDSIPTPATPAVSASPTPAENTAPTATETADTTESLPWTIRLDELRLTDNAARYGLAYGEPLPTLDPNHIVLSGLNLSLDSIYNRGTEIRARLTGLSFTERSGLAVTQTTGSMSMDSSGYALHDFELLTTTSSLRADLSVGADIATLSPATPLNVQLTLQVGSTDLFRLTEIDRPLHRQLAGRSLTLDTRLSGTLGELRLHRLVASLPHAIDFIAEGRAHAITTPKHTTGHITFGGNLRNPRLIAHLLPDGIALPPTRFRGEASAETGVYQARLAIQAAGGRVSLDGSFRPQSEEYAAGLTIDSLPLDRFLPADSLGCVTLALRAEGRGFDPFAATTTADARLRIEQAEYNGFDYRNIDLTARLTDQQITGRLTSRNEGIDADLHLGGNLTAERQEATLTGAITHFDPERMGFVADSSSLSTRLDIRASAASGYTYSAQIALDSLTVRYGTFTDFVARTTLAAEADTSHVHLEFTSGDMQLAFHSRSSLDTLAAAFGRVNTEIQNQIWAGRVNTDTLEHLLPPFKLDFQAARNNVLNDYLRAQGAGFGRMNLTAAAADGNPFGFKTEINQLSSQGIVLDTLTAGVGGRNGQLQYFVRLANRPGNLNRMGLIALYGHAAGSTGQLSLTQRDRHGHTGLNFGLRATLGDSAVTVNLIPQRPIFGFSEWNVNDGNFVRYHFDRALEADLRVTRANQAFTLESVVVDSMPRGSIRLGLNGIDIANTLKLLPTAPPLGGRLGADLTFGMADSTLAAHGRVTVDTLLYDNRRVGDIGLKLAYRTDTLSGQEGSLALTIDHQTALTAEGRYNPADTTSALRLTADLPGIPLRAANPFLPEGSGSLAGMLRGHLQADDSLGTLRLGGSMKFDSTTVDVAAIGTRFGITDTPIELREDRILFNDFGLIAPNKHRLTLNGNIDLGDLSQINADLRVRANDFQLINVPRNRGSMVFGKASADLAAWVQGPLDALNIRGNVNLLTGTEVTYVMQDSPVGIEDRSQNVVTFVAFNDTTTVQANRPPAMLRLGGIDMLMNVAIDPDVQVSVYLSEDGQNRINLQGGGNLTYSMNRLGDTRFAGKYELTGGRVRYTPPVISTKDFSITPGGYVSWTGDMLDPTFAIRAVETVRTTVTLEDQTSRQVNFQIIVNIRGSLETLDLSLDLAAPEDLTLQNQLASLTAEQRQNQAMSLLIYNTYSGPGTSAKVNTGNPLNSFIAKELNQWAQNSLRGVDLTFGIDSYDDPTAGAEGTRTDYSYKLSKKFFDNRVQITIGGKVSTGGEDVQNTAENLVDDISLEYQLTRRDNMYLKLFRETNFESILEGEVTETGIGFGVRKKILKLGDLFKITKTKQELKATRKADRKAKRQQKRQSDNTPEQETTVPAQPATEEQTAAPEN